MYINNDSLSLCCIVIIIQFVFLLLLQNQLARGMSVIDSDLDEEGEDSVSSGESLDARF